MPSRSLDFPRFRLAVAAANRHFAVICKKHPDLRAHLDLGLRGEQAKMTDDPTELLQQFPAMVLDGGAKSKVLELIGKLKPKEAARPEQILLMEKIRDLSGNLEINGNVHVELRFDDLDYELIFKLQSDPLIDRDLTPQTRASIRIVLGTISSFVNSEFER